VNPIWRSFLAGVRAELPLLLSVTPFGMIYGALALNAGLSRSMSQAMSAIVFAGSAQLVSTQLIHEGAPGLIIILSIGIVNLRHLLYSASIAPYLKELPMRWRALLAYLLTDEAYGPSIVQYEREGVTPTAHWFLLGAGLALWSTWQASSALGIFVGKAIPDSWPLDFALPLTFIAMLIPRLRDRPMLAAALSAGAVAIMTNAWPYKLGLLAAAVAGICTGLLVERGK
jgi:4-azaleucine resistance transporter AzlC